MLTAPPIRRSVMVLCFGAAGLLLAAEWHMLRSQPEVAVRFTTSRLGRLATLLQKPPVAGLARQTKVVIRLGPRRLDYYEGEQLIHSYDIAVGQAEWQTPTGEFAILDMRRDPFWQHPITGDAIGPGPENPLGTRWIGFTHDDGYHIGIHGTNQEELVGQAVSHGCVRMREADIQQMFEELAIGTPIYVRPD